MTDYTPPPPSSVPPTASPVSGGEIIHPSQPPKDPVLICVLNLFVLGGLGYILIGQKTKGIVAIIIWLVLAIPTCLAGSLLLALIAAIDGYFQAQALQQGKPIGQWTFFQQTK